MAKASHCAEEGKWHEKLMCHVQQLAYDFRTRTAKLDFPAGACCDMTGAVNFCTKIDPDIRVIETFAGGTPDTVYRRNLGNGEWTALMPATE